MAARIIKYYRIDCDTSGCPSKTSESESLADIESAALKAGWLETDILGLWFCQSCKVERARKFIR
jgi:hypothetical protein